MTDITNRAQDAEDGGLSRREVIQRSIAAGVGATAAAAYVHSNAAAQEEADAIDYSAGVRGGTLRVAMPSDLPTLDVTTTGNVFPNQVVWSVCESLFTYDGDFNLVPMLAESVSVSDDDLTYTIPLRQGVPFHDGSEMTATDVVASMERWMNLSVPGGQVRDRLVNLAAVDDYTVEIQLESTYGALLDALTIGSRSCPIYPASFVEEAGEEPVETLIGTGPYRFIEWQPDRFIRVERFEEYASLEGEPDGYSGAKLAFSDEIVFTPVPDEAARVAGLRAGDYDYLTELNSVHFESLQSEPDVTVERLPVPWTKINLTANMNSPVLSNVTMRQALQAVIDPEPVMLGSVGEGFYELNPAIMTQATPWYTEVGSEFYNQADPEKAAELLEEAGYDGETLRLVTGGRHESRAVIITQQLESIGVVIDLQVVEQNTFNQIVTTTDDWELTVNGNTFVPDPSKLGIMQMCPFLGHWCDDESVELSELIVTEPEFEDRFAALEGYQRNYFELAPYILIGDWLIMQARRANVQGQIVHTALGNTLWNVWVER